MLNIQIDSIPEYFFPSFHLLQKFILLFCFQGIPAKRVGLLHGVNPTRNFRSKPQPTSGTVKISVSITIFFWFNMIHTFFSQSSEVVRKDRVAPPYGFNFKHANFDKKILSKKNLFQTNRENCFLFTNTKIGRVYLYTLLVISR